MERISRNVTVEPGVSENPGLRRDLQTQLYINISNIINLFHSWDKNLDGMVSPEEFTKALQDLGVELLDTAEFQRLWDMIDTDNNGQLSLLELRDAIARCANTVTCPIPSPPSRLRVEALRSIYGDGLTDAEQETLRRSMGHTPLPQRPSLAPAPCSKRARRFWEARHTLGARPCHRAPRHCLHTPPSHGPSQPLSRAWGHPGT